MRPKRDVSIADGFWTSLAFTGPLLLLGAFPALPASVQRAWLFLAFFLGLAAMVRPFVHLHLRGPQTKGRWRTEAPSPPKLSPTRPLAS
jgi:hypothetical protein